MICVNCALPVQTLFTEYGKGHIQLTQCVSLLIPPFSHF